MSWDISNLNNWTSDEYPIGAVIPEGGNSNLYSTGGWRSERPVWAEEKCTQCGLCFIYCPDTSVVWKDGKMTGFDLEHCKGCGICAHECPVNPKFESKAIEMVPEGCELKVVE